MGNIDFSLVDWSRAQFALTAMYHWIFVPLTLGLSFILAIMESIYVKTGNPEWKNTTKFWMTIFGINFAIGVATGIILEFEFGTNWSNYSWFVGDIFGAPLAIEGIMAFFMESTFIAVMFFGWNKVSKKFHLVATWLVAIGSNLSALWILIANGWMQSPSGTKFNPDTARNEMIDFWEILFSPIGINKFLHTITSAYVLASIVVIGISSYYLLKNRHSLFAKKSIIVAAVFGLLASFYLIATGDGSAKQVAKYQPMKLAVMEGLYEGSEGAPLQAIGVIVDAPTEKNPNQKEVKMNIALPGGLSFLSFGDFNAFVPGINDLLYGNPKYGIEPYNEKIAKGRLAIDALKNYSLAKKAGNKEEAKQHLAVLNANYKYFGYGYYDGRSVQELVPDVPLIFYSFHIMVGLGSYFVVFFILMLFLTMKNKIEDNRLILMLAVLTTPLAYIAQQTGWIVAEVGRQPWVIQDLMPTIAAVSQISSTNVMITFGLFLLVFTALLIAELKIIFSQIKKGPETHSGNH